MNLPDLLLWGLVATVLLTTSLSAAQGLGLSRMSLLLILGTFVTPDRSRASAYGFGIQLLMGWAFSLLYALVFESLRRAGWWIGGALGAFHGLAVLLVLMPLLPGLHPRMASSHQGPEPTRELEPPGFLALHYGRRTPLVVLVTHVLYGAVLGAFYHPGGG
jgi:hypothetical protein